MIKKDDVDQAVLDFCMEVVKEPLIFFNEYDLHLLLVEKLYDKYKILKEKKYNTNLSYKKNLHDNYKTRLIHREYGRGNSTRCDIVIFDEKDAKNIENSHLCLKKDDDYLSPKFAFELGISLEDTKKHINSDIAKLSKCKKDGKGYIIHIIRNDNKEESIKKGKTIEEKFKYIIDKTNPIIPPNIKMIAIILNIFKKNDEFYCEIFDKRGNEWKSFDKSDNEAIRETIKLQL